MSLTPLAGMCNETTHRAATLLRARKVPCNVTARERMGARGSEYCCNVTLWLFRFGQFDVQQRWHADWLSG
jgi:hypothetical protein